MSPLFRQYVVRLGLAYLVYVLILVVLRPLLATTSSPPLQLAIALLPTLPAIAMVMVAIWYFRRIDELRRRIIGEALTVSFFVVGLGTFSYSFLEVYLDYPKLPTMLVLPALLAGFGVAKFLVKRRYR